MKLIQYQCEVCRQKFRNPEEGTLLAYAMEFHSHDGLNKVEYNVVLDHASHHICKWCIDAIKTTVAPLSASV